MAEANPPPTPPEQIPDDPDIPPVEGWQGPPPPDVGGTPDPYDDPFENPFAPIVPGPGDPPPPTIGVDPNAPLPAPDPPPGYSDTDTPLGEP